MLKYNIQKLKHHFKMSYQLADDETKFWQQYPRMIGPAEIYEVKSHLIVDNDTFIETIIVGIPDANLRGYPKGLNRHIMDELTDLNTKGCRVSISFSLVPVPIPEASRMLSDVITMNRQNQITAKKQEVANGVEQVPLDLIFDYEDEKENSKRFHDRKHNVFHSTLIIVLAAKSIDALRTTKSIVVNKLKGKLVLSESPQWRQKETFLLAQAFPGWKPYASVEVFTETAAVLAPLRTPNAKMDTEGQYYGIDVKTKKKIVINEKKLSSRSKLILGPTGSGKTTLVLKLLMIAHDLLDKRVIITSNKQDTVTNIGNVSRYYEEKGAVISIGPEGDNIQPLQILYDESEMKTKEGKIDSFQYVLAYDNQKGLLQKFFDVFLKGTSPPQRSRLDKYFNEAYNLKGIYRNDPASWKDAEWPTIAGDLRPLFKRDMDHDVSAEALYHNTFQFDYEGELGYMSRKTNIDLTKSFIYLDLSKIPTICMDAMNVLVVGLLSMRFRTDMTKGTIICMDEAGAVIRNPEIAEFLLRLISQSRSFNMEGWFATQDPTALIAAGVSNQMKTNIPINIILGENLNADSIEIVHNYLKLTPEEKRFLITATVGKGILKVQNMSWNVDFKLTEHELGIIKGTVTKTSQKALMPSAFTVKKDVVSIARQNHIIFDSWIVGDGDPADFMKDHGFIRKSVQDAFGTGQVGAWIEKSIITDGKIINQSIDHYATCCQIIGDLRLRGIDCDIQHTDGPDVIAKLPDGKTLSIEFEKSGTHTAVQIFDKHQANIQAYDKCLVVTTSQNYAEVQGAIGYQDVIARGEKLRSKIDEKLIELKGDNLHNSEV